jgi:alanyl aminopeptidase
VVENIARSVGWLRDGELVSEKLRPAYAKYIRDLFGARAKQLGWVPKKGDDEDTRLLRARLLPLVASVGEDPALIAGAKKLAAAWLKDHKAVDPDLVGAVLAVAAEFGDKALYDSWMKAARTEKDRIDRVKLLHALAGFVDPAIVKEALPVVLTDSFDAREAIALMWGPSSDPRTRKLVWEWLQANFDALVARLPRDYGAHLPFAAVGQCDEQLVAPVRAFFAERSKKFEGGPRQLEQALEQLHLCAVFKTDQTPSVERFFSKKTKAK